MGKSKGSLIGGCQVAKSAEKTASLVAFAINQCSECFFGGHWSSFIVFAWGLKTTGGKERHLEVAGQQGIVVRSWRGECRLSKLGGTRFDQQISSPCLQEGKLF